MATTEASLKEDDIYKISEQQRLVLLASEKDIAYGGLISDEELNNEEDEWLKE